MRGVLRVSAGPAESASRAVFPAVVHRLFRGYLIGARDCVAGRGFAEPAGVPGLGRYRGDAEPFDVVTHTASDRRGNARGGVHVGAGTVGGSGSVQGKRSASTRRRWKRTRRCGASNVGRRENRTRRSCVGWRPASGIETPTRAELARFDRSRKDRKTSNKEWQSPQDPDAKIAKMKDGRTHLAHKAEHGVDLETVSHPFGAGAGGVGRRYGDVSGDADDGGGTSRGGTAGR